MLLARARLDHVQLEFRAQLDAVVDLGLNPTHLDFHCLADGGREDILDLTVAIAAEYGLAVRVWLDSGRRVRRTDYEFLPSPETRDLLRREGLVGIVSTAIRQAWS